MLDANLSSARIGEPLRNQGHDVRGASGEPGLEGLDDEPLLALAAQERRILITRNSRDFAPICRAWAESRRQHAGVILVWSLSHRQYGEIIRGIEHWLSEIPSAGDWRGLVVAI